MSLVAIGILTATTAFAQSVGSQTWVPDLSGTYRCVQNCARGRLVHIQQRFRQLEVTYGNQPAAAWVSWPGHISTSWNDNAVYSPDGATIQFTSGTLWVLIAPTPAPGRNWNE